MFGFIKRMMGSQSAVDKAIDGLYNGLDKLVYTGEEKAEDQRMATQQAREMALKWMDATQGQNIARRFLAMSLTMLWGAIFGAQVLLSSVAPWCAEETTLKIMVSVDALNQASDQLTGAMMLILGFYFAAPHLSKIAPLAMARFGKTKEQKQ
jgi:hypothetical protein